MAKQIPGTAAQLTELASDVYNRLVTRYEADGQVFLDDECEKDGLILSCAGPISLLLLVNNFDAVGRDKRWPDIVRREFNRVEQHVREKGYDATPHVPEKITEKLFSKSAGYYYTDSLSWVLSFTTQIRVAAYRKKLFDDPELLERVQLLMKDALVKICDSACENGGWNFSNGCTAPHLYYSFAVTEALADFGDYVLGETPELFGFPKGAKQEAEDRELCKFLSGPLVKRVNETREKLLEYLYDTYIEGKVLGESEVEPVEVKGATVPNKHLLLYYSYFVIEMLVTCNLPEFRPEWDEKINDKMELAIYLSRTDLARAIGDLTVKVEGGKPWFDDAKASTLWLDQWSQFREPNLIPAENKLSKLGEPGLIPLAVRCNAQYAYYVAKGKDAHMGKLFALLLDDRDEKDGHFLWDAEGYNLLITERAVEAIVDYYDYLLEYQSDTSVAGGELAKQSRIEIALRDIVKSEVEAQLSASGNGATDEGDQKAVLTETELLSLLTSTLTKGEKYLLEGDLDSSMKTSTFDMFERTLRSFMSALIYHRLKEATGNEEQQQNLRKSLDVASDNLVDALGPLLGREVGADLGNALLYMVRQADKEQEKQQLRPTDSGKRGPKG